jgi:hypothetical protein
MNNTPLKFIILSLNIDFFNSGKRKFKFLSNFSGKNISFSGRKRSMHKADMRRLQA